MRLHVLIVASILASPVLLCATDAPGVAHTVVHGYIRKGSIDWKAVIPPPPAPGSLADKLDIGSVFYLQRRTSDARWTAAKRDEERLYPQFVQAFGAPIDRARDPILIHILNRTEKDVDAPVVVAKDLFQRPRPYQRLHLQRVCSPDEPLAPHAPPVRRDSYPSGHASRGWTVALLLAQVAPDRAPQILARASDYGLSREICGMHFPSDIEAGRVIAVDVLSRLVSVPEFESDLACAKAEHRRLADPGSSMPTTCAGITAGPRSQAE